MELPSCLNENTVQRKKNVKFSIFFRYLKLVKKHGLEISQPGLDPVRGTTWAMTRRRYDTEVHKYELLIFLQLLLMG